MKKLFTTLVLAILCSTNLLADGITVDGIYYENINGIMTLFPQVAGTNTVKTGNVVIPATIGGKTLHNVGATVGSQVLQPCVLPKVTSVTFKGEVAIGAEAFMRSEIESISLPLGSSIGANAFRDCKKLKTVIFTTPVDNMGFDGLVIGESAFEGCSSLTEIIFIGTAYKTYNIRKGAFRGCTSLTSVTGVKHIKSIESLAFADCTSLKEISLQNVNIASDAFHNCTSLATVSLTNMGMTGWSFKGNEAITTLYLENCPQIPAEAFRGCYNLAKITSTGSSTAVGSYAFADCPSLNDVYFSSITAIDEGGFMGCTALEDFGSSKLALTRVGNRAFENCTGLNGYINLSSCSDLGEYIFNNAGTEDLHITISLNPCLKNTLSGCRAGYLTCNDTRLYNNYEARNNQSPLNGSMFQNVFLPNLTAALPEYLFYNMPALSLVSADKLESADNLTKNFTYCPAFTNLDINNSTKLYSELMDAGVYSKDRTILYYVLPNATYYKADAKTKKVYADCADQYLWGSIGSKLGVLDLSNTMLLSEDEVVLYKNPKSTTTRPCSYVRIPYGKRNKYKTFADARMEFITDYIKGDVDEDGKVTIADANAAVNLSLGK